MDDVALSAPAAARQVPARTIATPRTASPQLQRFIAAAASAPLGDLSRAPETAEKWRAFVAANAQLGLKRVAAIGAMYPCDVAETQMDGVTVRWITPASLDPVKTGRVLMHLHGGGYVLSPGEAGLSEGLLCAHFACTPVISVDYRMPPDHPFPAAIDDAITVWRALIRTHAPASVGVFGASAGGGLLLAMTSRLKALGLPLPGALAPNTPWADLEGESDSYAVNALVDSILPQYDGVAAAMARLYAGATSLRDPLISPVHADFTGFPPSILTTGTRDLLLSDTVRVYRAMRAVGVEARLEVYEALSHAEYNYAFDSPETASTFTDIGRFFERHLTA